jgi:hypothetical protein
MALPVVEFNTEDELSFSNRLTYNQQLKTVALLDAVPPQCNASEQKNGFNEGYYTEKLPKSLTDIPFC